MSSGRTTPATVSSRRSLLVFTSCLPWITRLPLGSTLVTTAAMVRLIWSWRWIWPVPVSWLSPLVWMALAGSKPLGMIRVSAVSSPSRCGMPMVLALLRSRVVLLVMLALSSMVISTVRMSPTLAARWSEKKVCAPARHRELLVARGCSCGRITGCSVASRADG